MIQRSIFLWILFSDFIVEAVTSEQDDASLNIHPVLRLSERPTIIEFEEKFATKEEEQAIPIVLEHNPAIDDFDPSWFTRSKILEICGDFKLVENIEDCHNPTNAERRKSSDCHSIKVRREKTADEGEPVVWAGLDFADPVGKNLTTIRDLLQAQDSEEEFTNWYLHDAPLSEVCPPMVSKLRVPPYFTRDYHLLQYNEFTPESIKRGTMFPSIFVSKKGTGSGLHADSGRSRFWTRQLSGRKLWRLSPPSQYSKLHPVYQDNTHSPTMFQASILDPDFEKHPSLNQTIVYETILAPGDILFVPGGWAHEVRNLDDAIMIGQNYFDDVVLRERKQYYSELRHVYEGSLLDSVFMPIGPPLFPRDDETLNKGMDYESFYRAQFSPYLPVSTHLREWFKREGRESLVSYRDKKSGLGLLHLATYYHYISVVEFLIEEVGFDVNEMNRNVTSLDIAKQIKKRVRLQNYLKEKGGMIASEIINSKLSGWQ